MDHAWASSVLDNVTKPVLLSLFSTRARLVDVNCGSCGEQLAMVTEAANGPLLTVWTPSANSPAGAGGETLWAMASGPVPKDARVPVRCFEHGYGVVEPTALHEKVVRYRSEGVGQVLPVEVGLDGPQRALTR
ncbi:MAG: hypothetical protein ACRD0S_04535 [Acidimicrobiales bacterium]